MGWWGSQIAINIKLYIRSLRKLASGSEVQGAHGTEDRSVFNIHEDLSTGATTQFAAEVEFQKRSIAPKHVQ
jgi:glutaredoxin 2